MTFAPLKHGMPQGIEDFPMTRPVKFPFALRQASAAFGVALATALLALPAAAAEEKDISKLYPTVIKVDPGSDVVARRLKLAKGQAVIVELPADAKEVFVANPRVANAVVRNARKLYLIGMADGQTTIFAVDAGGRQFAHIEVTIGTQETGSLEALLRAAMPRAQIKTSYVSGSIILSGEVDSAGEAAQAMDIAKAYVRRVTSASTGGGETAGSESEGKVINSLIIRGRDQVMLKVTVAEVQRTVVKQLGINLEGGWRIGHFNAKALIDNPLGLQGKALTDTLISIGSGQNGVNIRALERGGVLRTLAEPTLTAISGETAKFTAGGEIPVPASSAPITDPITGRTTFSIGITYKPVGVALVFTPIVLSEGRISLRVATEVSELDAENSARIDAIAVPAVRVRKSDTTVELPSGASLVTAGLIQRVNRQVISGFPGLMNLPVLGTLFRSRDYNRQETELMIIVTPFIAKPSQPGKLVTPNEGFVDAHDLQSILLGRINKIYGVAGAPNTGARYRGHIGFIAD
jgi:pilus assembly protein CpaC